MAVVLKIESSSCVPHNGHTKDKTSSVFVGDEVDTVYSAFRRLAYPMYFLDKVLSGTEVLSPRV